MVEWAWIIPLFYLLLLLVWMKMEKIVNNPYF